MARPTRSTTFRSYASALRAQTMEVGRRARRQLLVLLPLLAATLLVNEFRDELFGSDEAARIAIAAVLFVIGWAFARSLGQSLEPQLATRLDPGASGFVGFVVRLVALVVIGFASLRIAGLDPSTLIVGASVTAVIIGLAAQQTAGNILAGFVLLATHPFQIGDRVRFHGFGMDVEGTVAAHGLLHLTLTDGEDTVKIPNNTALTMSIRPLREPASLDMRARLPASVDPEVIKDRIVAAVTLATRDTPHVSLEEFDGGSIVVRIRATPVESREGGKLAREVLTAVSALHEENLAPEHSVA